MTEQFYMIEQQLPTGKWQQLSSGIFDIEDARLSLEDIRTEHPSQKFQLVKITSTLEVIDA